MSQCQGHHREGKTEDLSLEETKETQGQDATWDSRTKDVRGQAGEMCIRSIVQVNETGPISLT